MAEQFNHQVDMLATSLTQLFKQFTHSNNLDDVIFGMILIGLGYITAKILTKTVLSTFGRRMNAHQRMIWGRGIFYLVFLFFLAAGMREMGFKLSVFLGAAGLLTVALGFASQTSASNLISGLFLIGESPFAVNDYIRIGDIEGTVISIDFMSVKLLTLDNIYIRLPNEMLIKTPVQNLTRFPIRRVPITLRIGLNEDIAKVRQVLNQIASEYPLALNEPIPFISVQSFHESHIEVLFAVWTQVNFFLQVRDEIQERVKQGFDANGINLPYPQMMIHQGAPYVYRNDNPTTEKRHPPFMQ